MFLYALLIIIIAKQSLLITEQNVLTREHASITKISW